MGTINWEFFIDKEGTKPIPQKFNIIAGAKLPLYMKNTGEELLRDIKITVEMFDAVFVKEIAMLAPGKVAEPIILETDKDEIDKWYDGKIIVDFWPFRNHG